MIKNIVIIGGSGAIGQAFTQVLAEKYPDATLQVFSRKVVSCEGEFFPLDHYDESSLSHAANQAFEKGPIDLVIVATGILHDDRVKPEKSLKMISAANLHHLYEANAVVPALIAKYFLPKLNTNHRSVFAALSARVGSISDNQLGGWYAYRASKAALNMLLKTAAIELARTNKQAVVVGLHPGTVDSELSKPFQSNVPEGKLFEPLFSAKKMLSVIERLTPKESGQLVAWDGECIQP